jgi:hypothetical protein
VSQRKRTVLSIAVVALALAGCGGGSGETATSTALWCNGVCTAVNRCGYDDPGCYRDCVNQNPELAEESTNGAAAEEPCLAGLSCQAVGGDETAWKNELDACWQQAKMSAPITPHVRQVCAADSLAWFDCGYSFALDVCEHDYAMWADSVLDRLTPCQAMSSCDAFMACENAVFGSS